LRKVILTVQSTNSSWRLGLNKNDSITYFKHREEIKFVLPNFEIFCVKTACGTSNKKAFDFNGKFTINKWIEMNKYQKYTKGNPTKLIFELVLKQDAKILKFKRKKTSP
jgi:hypothetical protein